MGRKQTEAIETYLLAVIEGRDRSRRASLLRAVLKVLSKVFTVVVQLRLWLYTHGVFRPHSLGCQVISVGNVTVGGTGKTPIVEKLARELQQSGRKVAILSRGYRREQPSFAEKWSRRLRLKTDSSEPLVVSDGERLLMGSARSGDEPYMLASNLPEVVVLVDKDRVKAGRYAIRRFGCDTLILDDGFQYLSLQHRLDIVLVDRTNPFGNRNVLPRGLLREPAKNIQRAGFIFITKSSGDGAEVLRKQLRELNPDAEIAECRHCPRYLQNVYTREQQDLEMLRGLKVVAVSGIAVPQGFEQGLTRLGAEVLHHTVYADHHRYLQDEIIDVVNTGLRLGADAILTTEKDAVRFPLMERFDLPIYFLRVEIEMFSGVEAFDKWVQRIGFRQGS